MINWRHLGHQFITLSVDICVQHGGPETLCRAGLSAAVETCCYLRWRRSFNKEQSSCGRDLVTGFKNKH